VGYTTVVKIINDGFDQLENNPEEFVKQVRDGMLYGGERGVGNHANVIQVMKAQHSDIFQLHAIHRNFAMELSPYSAATEMLAERIPDEIRSRIEEARYLLDRLEEMLPND